MATVLVQQQALHHSTPPPSPIPSALTVTRRSSPIPNRHIPVCPTGPIPTSQPTSVSQANEQPSSLLSPPDEKMRIGRLSSPAVYAIDGAKLAAAIAHQASQPLPDASLMFPWLHGLHRDNHLQLGFFSSRKRHARHTPKCWRGLMVVKLGEDLSRSRIKGAVSAHEVLAPSSHFLMADPPEGFSVRNFQIQTAKLAAMSDIVIYAEDDDSHSGLVELANQFAKAQRLWRTKMDPLEERPTYNTFILAGSLLYLIPRIHGPSIDILPQTNFPILRKNTQRSLPSTQTATRQAKLWISVTSNEPWRARSLC